MAAKKSSKVKIGFSVGDLNGIGMEIILKTLEDNRICELCTPIIYGSRRLTNYYAKAFNLKNLNINYIDSLDKVKSSKVNVLNVWEEEVNINAGEADPTSGSYAYKSLKALADDVKAGNIDAMVTAPINKKVIQSADFDFPGHTEFLQKIDEAEDVLMLMLSEEARIGVVTGHIPLKEVANQLNTDLILKKITLLNKSLKEDFGIRKPKIAVMGLNPHAGDNGLLGKEEIEIIEPAIKQAKSIEILALGPYPADGFFGSSKHKDFDGVIAMYHDQGLIPAKQFSFGEGVNFTAGLSIVRTSPDHGTAFEIAGEGTADEGSLRNAMYKAIDIVKQRKLNEELKADALEENKK
ncbi:MAG: 4-hydroxythreonine-4-phosphate dehydrogenase PdxA [Flavobacteriales bacterium]|mgnify:CR=1 FL=1|nr:4-hydroxythreonine-4-phosphate dehydrogenase PdxA [Flavobacteriales bacterium]|tara:strand:+ start:4650 stop:5702 length:1053 start_codon:yes stop_codon:yes gene_type:complete